VIIQVGYFRITAALAVTTVRPSSSSSALSSGKYAGLNGESRLRSSSDRPLMLSSAIASGSGGTGSASVVRGGGGGTLLAGGAPPGGAGCASGGGCFFAHAPIVRVSKSSTTAAVIVTLCISRLFFARGVVERMNPRAPIELFAISSTTKA
jgi:hypothetical protein